jgi:hypothetical protein
MLNSVRYIPKIFGIYCTCALAVHILHLMFVECSSIIIFFCDRSLLNRERNTGKQAFYIAIGNFIFNIPTRMKDLIGKVIETILIKLEYIYKVPVSIYQALSAKKQKPTVTRH